MPPRFLVSVTAGTARPAEAGQPTGVGGAPGRAAAREGATWPTPHGGPAPPFTR